MQKYFYISYILHRFYTATVARLISISQSLVKICLSPQYFIEIFHKRLEHARVVNFEL